MVTVETIPVLGIVCGGNQLWLNGSAGCATVSAEVGPDTWEKSTCDASFSPSALLKVGYAPKCWLTCAAPLITTQATATIDNAFTRARAGRRTAIANAAAPSPVHSTATQEGDQGTPPEHVDRNHRNRCSSRPDEQRRRPGGR